MIWGYINTEEAMESIAFSDKIKMKLKMKKIKLFLFNCPLKEYNLSTLIHFIPNCIRNAAKRSEWTVSDDQTWTGFTKN